MAVGLEQFVTQLAESGLMTTAEVQAFQEAFRPSQRPKSAEALATELVRAKKLTKYQAAAVYQGKTRGLVFGDYRVLDKLGQGGMGVVLKAEHRRMKRPVAVKMISGAAMKSPDAIKRFYREVEAAAKLEHPNIVTAHDAGEHEGVHYLVMQFIDGKDLGAIVKEKGPLPVEQAVDCMIQVARGLQYAHKQGIVHRDIKPANLLVDQEGTVKILDMGLARVVLGGQDEQDRLTASGQVMGTCDYMAPEQAMDTHQADARADIYSLGCTLYRLLTGAVMYQGDSLVKILMAHQQSPIPSLQNCRPDVSPQLDAVFQKMVAKLPADRHQSMADVIADLEECLGRKAAAAPGLVETPETLDRSMMDNLSFLQQQSPPAASSTAARKKVKAGTMAETVAYPDDGETGSHLGLAQRLLAFPRRNKPLAIAIGVAIPSVIAIVLFAVTIRVRHPDGRQTTVRVPEGSAVRVGEDGAVDVNVKAEEGTEAQRHNADGAGGGPWVDSLAEWCAVHGKENDVQKRLAKEAGGCRVGTIGSVLAWDKRGNISNVAIRATVRGARYWSVCLRTAPNNSRYRAQVNEKDGGIWHDPGGQTELLKKFDLPSSFAVAQPHTGEFRAQGDTLVFLLDGVEVTRVEDNRRTYGGGYLVAAPGTLVEKLEYRELPAPAGGGPWIDGLGEWWAAHEKDKDVQRRLAKEPGGSRVGTIQSIRAWEKRGGNIADAAIRATVRSGPKGWSLCLRTGDKNSRYVAGIGPRSGKIALDGEEGDQIVLKEFPLPVGFVVADRHTSEFRAQGNTLVYLLDGIELARVEDNRRATGSGYLFADPGTLVEKLEYRELPPPQQRPGPSASSPIADPQSPIPASAVAPFDARKAKHHQEAWAKHLGVPVEQTNSMGMKLALIPPGEFDMGSTPQEIAWALAEAGGTDRGFLNRVAGEGPRHRVRIGKPFYFGAYQVTQREYETVMGMNPSTFCAKQAEGSRFTPPLEPKLVADRQKVLKKVAGKDTSRHPVETISWQDANEFCARLTALPAERAAGRAYRLPTEAEWEYACRAGTTSRWSFGTDPTGLGNAAWIAENSESATHPVGQKRPNAWGLYDVHGNVLQWCADWFSLDYYRQSPSDDPGGPATGDYRIVRGGRYFSVPATCRSACRYATLPDGRDFFNGLRVVAEIRRKAEGGKRKAEEGAAVGQQTAGSARQASPPLPRAEGTRGESRGEGAPPPAIAPFDAQKARQHQEAWAKHLGVQVPTTNSIGMKLVLIPPGEFNMGSTPQEQGRAMEEVRKLKGDNTWSVERIASEVPLHRVKITRPFSLGACPVTQREYELVMNVNPSAFTAKQLPLSAFNPPPLDSETNGRRENGQRVAGKDTSDRPVEMVSWDEATEFCRKLSAMPGERDAGRTYRLPTEAEWEYACRAGATTLWSCSDDERELPQYAWFATNSDGMTQPVGRKGANAWGLYDVHGNVRQWCADWFSADYYAHSPPSDPQGPATGARRVMRGGDWRYGAWDCRSAFRTDRDSRMRSHTYGLRVVAEIQRKADSFSSSFDRDSFRFGNPSIEDRRDTSPRQQSRADPGPAR